MSSECTDIAASEVTALKHEVRDDTVKLRARVSKALLPGAECTKVLGGFWDDIVVEGEIDATGLIWRRIPISIMSILNTEKYTVLLKGKESKETEGGWKETNADP